MITTEPCRQWNPCAGEWQTVKVEITQPEPRRRRTSQHRAVRHGEPRDLSGLSNGSPLPAWWRDTAYAPPEPLADMRTWSKPPAMRTHRAVTVMPADPGRITETGRR
jgi:hypothetical protein